MTAHNHDFAASRNADRDAFRTALDINPELDSIREAVSALTTAFGDD